jgi:hypothetical protein
VQALLLMTYWYENPDDQKDTWHWMGVAMSMAHTVGLHRNPANTNMPERKQKLWKRIWWSCVMRDRLIALGMRRPTRIKDEDFDVPMLEESDFEIAALPAENRLLGPDCALIRDLDMQRQLALLCIQIEKLSKCIGHMIMAQYSILSAEASRRRPDTSSGGSSNITMLFPNKGLDTAENVRAVDVELTTWYANLPPECQYRPLVPEDIKHGKSTVAVQRNFLHMVYHTTVSALHRPQFLPSSPGQPPLVPQQVQDMARMRVRDAVGQITRISAELYELRLARYLPTSGVTVVLPAMIIHLLEMNSPNPVARVAAIRGFRYCLRVMEGLRDMYAAADFACGFLEAALRKAGIDLTGAEPPRQPNPQQQQQQQQQQLAAGKPAATAPVVQRLEVAPQLPPPPPPATVSPQQAMLQNSPGSQSRTEDLSTPPPDNNAEEVDQPPTAINHMEQPKRNNYLVGGHSPPHTESQSEAATNSSAASSSASSSAGEPEREGESMLGHADASVMMNGQDDFDWNAITAPSLDFDQWLQFPAEGINNSDETFMDMFGGSGTASTARGAATPGTSAFWEEAVRL